MAAIGSMSMDRWQQRLFDQWRSEYVEQAVCLMTQTVVTVGKPQYTIYAIKQVKPLKREGALANTKVVKTH